MQPDIIIIGHIIHETIQFPDRVITPVLGSPAAYCSVIAAVLGARVGLVTKIGPDFPSQLLVPFAEAGVEPRGILSEGPTSTRNLLIYDAAGQKQVRYLHKAPKIVAADVPEPYRAARLAFVCPMDYEVPISTVRDLRSLKAQIIVDLGGYGGATAATHPAPDQRPPDALKELASLADVVKGSIEDCRHLFGADVSEEEIARSFVNWGARVGIITLGQRGALVMTKAGAYYAPSYPSTAIDVTGAGDSFSAGFLVEYLRTGDPRRAACFGCATASLVIEGTGGVRAARMPTSEQVGARLQVRPIAPSLPLPEPLLNSEVGSFAYHTIIDRLPAIIRQVIAENNYSPEIVANLNALAADLRDGMLRPIDDEGPDVAAWQVYLIPYLGKKWLDVAWYPSEVVFYRRLLEATRYFSDKPENRIDPFEPQKRAALRGSMSAIRALSTRVNTLANEQGWNRAGFILLAYFGLWGNRMDLSLRPGEETGESSRVQVHKEQANVLADDTEALADKVAGLHGAPVHFIVDNAGFELCCDLCLMDYLLASGTAGTITIHLKAHPTFVSDAMAKDVRYTIASLSADADAEARELASRLQGYLDTSRLILRENFCWTAPLAFWEMPDALQSELKEAALVVIKGDMNYRRLMGDRRWPHTTRLADITRYFPAPFLALRTLKSELAVGLTPGLAEATAQTDPKWLTDGRWGVIQLVDFPE